MARIKVTGYIDTADIDPEHVELEDSTGLSEEGHLTLIVDERGSGLKVADLDDVTCEVER